MFNSAFIQTDLFQWVILPALIFIARMSDVTLATLRNIFLSKSVKYIVPFLGFIEVLIWLLAISQIMRNLHNPVCFLAYALGYSLGIFVGIKIEERLALGLQIMRIFTHQGPDELRQILTQHDYGVTVIDAHGTKGPVKILLTIVKRKDINTIRELIKQHHPDAFYTIEDIRSVSKGVFPKNDQKTLESLNKIFPMVR